MTNWTRLELIRTIMNYKSLIRLTKLACDLYITHKN